MIRAFFASACVLAALVLIGGCGGQGGGGGVTPKLANPNDPKMKDVGGPVGIKGGGVGGGKAEAAPQ